MVPKVKRFREWLLAEMEKALAKLAELPNEGSGGRPRANLPPAAPTAERARRRDEIISATLRNRLRSFGDKIGVRRGAASGGRGSGLLGNGHADPKFPRDHRHPVRNRALRALLVYALSTITARSLPDVRDGLKPVHRRILWGMRLLRLDPAGAYKKSRARRRRRHRQIPPARRPVASTTRWSASRRISRCAIRWSTGRAISATSTAITPPPTATPRRG